MRGVTHDNNRSASLSLSFFTGNSGFTLLETLTVMGIIIILAVIVFVSFNRYSRGDLDIAVEETIAALQKARSLTLASREDAVYGVQVDSVNNKLTLYKNDPGTVVEEIVFGSRVRVEIALLEGALNGTLGGDANIDVDDPVREAAAVPYQSGGNKVIRFQDENPVCNGPDDDYVRVPYNAQLNLTSYTLAAWINPASFGCNGDSPGYCTVLGKSIDGATESNYWLSTITPGQIETGFYANGFFYENVANGPSDAIQLNIWTHVIATFDATTDASQIFINGTPAENLSSPTIPADPVPNTDDLSIGTDNLTCSYPPESFDGLIDEVLIYNRALSPAEATAVYQNNPSSNGLVVRYSFEEADNSQVIINSAPQDVDVLFQRLTGVTTDDVIVMLTSSQSGDQRLVYLYKTGAIEVQ